MVILVCLTSLKTKNILHKMFLYREELLLKSFVLTWRWVLFMNTSENDYKFYKYEGIRTRFMSKAVLKERIWSQAHSDYLGLHLTCIYIQGSAAWELSPTCLCSLWPWHSPQRNLDTKERGKGILLGLPSIKILKVNDICSQTALSWNIHRTCIARRIV